MTEYKTEFIESKIKGLASDIVASDPQSVIAMVQERLSEDKELLKELPDQEKEWLTKNRDYIISIIVDTIYAGILYTVFEHQGEGSWAYDIHKKVNQPYPSVRKKIRNLKKLELLFITPSIKGFDSKNRIYLNKKYRYVIRLLYEIIKKFYSNQIQRLFNQDSNRQLEHVHKNRKDIGNTQ